MSRIITLAFLVFIAQSLFVPCGVRATGIGDVTIKLNGGANVVYAGGAVNTLEF